MIPTVTTIMPTVTTITTDCTTPFIKFCSQYASIALVYYDYILTFPVEVKYIWGSKFRLSTFLYILCRYSMLANVLYLLAISNKLTNCDIWYKIIGVLSVLGRTAVIVTFTGRTYAIFSANRAVLIYLGVIGIICIAIDISHVPGLRCTGSTSVPILDNLLSILMVLFEFSSAILMIVRYVQAFKIGGEFSSGWRAQGGGFLYLVFKEGLLYFCCVSIVTGGSVIVNFIQTASFLQPPLHALINPLSCLLTARFLLHLRLWEDERRTVVSGKASRSGSGSGGSQTVSLPTFQAAPSVVSKSFSSVVEEFGVDPIVAATQMDDDETSREIESRESLSIDREEYPSPVAGSSRDAV